uniref:7TM_GPCR_Srx domain-containing protein n=1 Tax=Heterorhabditis bacteriophora TaxID=37862 RepID=A0A1I7XPM0_HETBA
MSDESDFDVSLQLRNILLGTMCNCAVIFFASRNCSLNIFGWIIFYSLLIKLF